jgi:hypothetical protein
VGRFTRGVVGNAIAVFLKFWHGLWSAIRYLPPKETRELLVYNLTLYGFFIGTLLAALAVVLVFDSVRVAIQPEFQKDSTSEIKVELEWNPDYMPHEEMEQALQDLLTGKAYQQPVEIVEYAEFRFPQSYYDLLNVRPRPVPSGALMFLKWRIGAVPPLPSDKEPKEALLPVMGDTWEWNIDDKLMTYIAGPQREVGMKVAWYKIAIAMVGGYSEHFAQGLTTDERIAAIDAFNGATWTYEVKYRVWNIGKAQAKSCRIIPGGKDTSIDPPEFVDWKCFAMQPGAANGLEFKLNPDGEFSSLSSAEKNVAEVQEKTEIVSQPLEVIPGSPWLWVGGAVLVGFILATLVKRFYPYRHIEH